MAFRWSLLEHTQQGSRIYCYRLQGRPAGKGPGVWVLLLLAASKRQSTLWTWVSCSSKAWHSTSWLHAAPSSGLVAERGLGLSLPMWTVKLADTSWVPWAPRNHQWPRTCVSEPWARLARPSPPFSKAVPVTCCSCRQSEGGEGEAQPGMDCEPAGGGCQLHHRHQVVLEEDGAITAGSGSA